MKEKLQGSQGESPISSEDSAKEEQLSNLTPEEVEAIRDIVIPRIKIFLEVDEDGEESREGDIEEELGRVLKLFDISKYLKEYVNRSFIGEDMYNFSEFNRIIKSRGREADFITLLDSEAYQNVRDNNKMKEYSDFIFDKDPDGDVFTPEFFKEVREIAEQRIPRD